MVTIGQVRDNPSQSRFELEADGEIAAAYYSRSPGVVTFLHTEVPASLSGHGVGSKLARGALEIVKGEGARVVAKCVFIAAFISKNPEFQPLL